MKRAKHPMLSSIASVAIVMVLSGAAYAGISVGGDVTPFDTTAWDSDTDLTVGSTSTGTVAISDSSTAAAAYGYIGHDSGSAGTVTVNDSDSAWVLDDNLQIGVAGAGTLMIASGGAVRNKKGYIGYTATTSNGAVSVDGAGSTWTNSSSLYVGYSGIGTLSITNDGAVTNTTSYLGYAEGSSGEVEVSGAGKWTASSSLYVGYKGAGTLEVNSGGTLSTKTCYVSYGTATTGAVTVDGAGSTWSNSSNLNIGHNNAGTLTVQNSGTVKVGNNFYLSSGSGSGIVNIDGGSSITVADTTYVDYKRASTGSLNFAGGTLTTAGLYVVDGTALITGNGTIESRGLVSNVDMTFDGAEIASFTFGTDVATTVDVSATSGNGDLGVGYDVGGTGTLLIKNDAHVYSDEGRIGYGAGSSGTASVDGIGTTWICRSYLGVGYAGVGRLYITNGGFVGSSNGNIGLSGETGTGLVEVNGSGSMWASTSLITIGKSGIGTLKVINDGVVSADGDLTISATAGAVGTLKIESGGAVSIADTTTVDAGGGNTGEIQFNGGTLTTGGLYVTDVTSRITGTGAITTRGLVSDVDMTFGSTAIASLTLGTNVATTVNMSATEGNGNLGVGYRGTGTMLIEDGAQVYSIAGYLGYELDSSGTATVDGTDTMWNAEDSQLYVGKLGHGTLKITNGATVRSKSGYVSAQTGSSGEVEVDGPGSAWITTSHLRVGYNGVGTLDITRGAAVTSGNGYIAGGKLATGVVTVDDSTWTNAKLYVGFSGTSTGTLNIQNGGKVITNSMLVGYLANKQCTGIINVDNGTLEAGASSATWLKIGGGDGFVYIQGGGATIDTAGHDVMVTAPILAGTVTTGGGLTKIGDGILTLAGANTYTGLTTVEAGVLELGVDAQASVLTGGADVLQNGVLAVQYAGTSTVDSIREALLYGLIYSSDATGTCGLGYSDDEIDTVSIQYALFGDSNLDGSVNGSDLNDVLSYYNQSDEIWGHGDFNYDGSVNGSDLNTVLSNYNQSLPASTAAVPEPSTLLLAVLGLVGLLACAWRKRK